MMQNPFDNSLPSCSALSLQVDEQLFGTAPLTSVWIMVEYPHPFQKKALEGSRIPNKVKAYLAEIQKTIRDSRVLLVRRENPKKDRSIKAFVGLPSSQKPHLYEFNLTKYEELLDLDLASLASGQIEKLEDLRKQPLFLVCTNARRDPCCALWGRKVYLQLANLAGDSVWQTSHVGGHRFAANVIFLPHGIYNGRLRPDQATSLIDNYRHNRLTLHNYRGRAHYAPVVQVAEYYLMEQTNILDIDTFQFLQSIKTAPNLWEIAFVSRSDGAKYHLEISVHQSTFNTYESCSTPEKRLPRLQYKLEKWSKS